MIVATVFWGKQVQAKKPLQACQACKFKCTENFTDDRKRIFDSYYALANLERQWDYICAHIEESPKEPTCEAAGSTKQRNVSRQVLANSSSFWSHFPLTEKVMRTAMT